MAYERREPTIAFDDRWLRDDEGIKVLDDDAPVPDVPLDDEVS